MKINKYFLNLFIMLLGVLVVNNLYAIDKCSTIDINFNNQIEDIFKNIRSVETCIKPASKYRLKTCIQRKREGSKGFNCLPELTKALNSNKKNDCQVILKKIKSLIQSLAILDEYKDSCSKLENK